MLSKILPYAEGNKADNSRKYPGSRIPRRVCARERQKGAMSDVTYIASDSAASCDPMY